MLLRSTLAWGAFQGAHGGRPWSPKHGRVRAAQLHWWIDRLHRRTLCGRARGSCRQIERGLQALAGDGRSSQTVKHYLASMRLSPIGVPSENTCFLIPVFYVVQFKWSTRGNDARTLTLAEVRQLAECCHPAHRLLYETALVTGLRANELRQLSLTHLDIDQCGLHLEAAWTKNRQPGWQPPVERLARAPVCVWPRRRAPRALPPCWQPDAIA